MQINVMQGKAELIMNNSLTATAVITTHPWRGFHRATEEAIERALLRLPVHLLLCPNEDGHTTPGTRHLMPCSVLWDPLSTNL